MLKRERLRDLLRERGVSQATLARRVGVSQQTIGRLVTGGAYSSRYLHLIARELGTTPAFLTGESDDPDSELPDAALLTSDEKDWVDLLRGLAPKDRAAALQLVRTIANSAASPLLQGGKQEFRGPRG